MFIGGGVNETEGQERCVYVVDIYGQFEMYAGDMCPGYGLPKRLSDFRRTSCRSSIKVQGSR